MYMEKVKIVQAAELADFKSIDEYLLHTYGKKKLNQSISNSNPTFLDVIGYTLDGQGFETVEAKAYELEEIEEMMNGNIEINDEEDSYC